MNYEWGRASEAGKWQRAVPVWFMSVMLLALVSGIGVWWIRQTFVWTPLQQFYFSAYVRSALATSIGIRTGRYRLLMMENRRGIRLAIDEEVVPITLSTGESTFALSELARQAGSGRLVWRDLVVNHARLHAPSSRATYSSWATRAPANRRSSDSCFVSSKTAATARSCTTRRSTTHRSSTR